MDSVWLMDYKGLSEKNPVNAGEDGGIRFHPPDATRTSATTVHPPFSREALHILRHDLILFEKMKPCAPEF